MIDIQIILGSTRQNREGEKVAKWIHSEAKKRNDFRADYIDLCDYPLPFYNESGTPSMLKGNYSSDIAKKWAEKIKEADAYIFVTPEYNHGYPAVLKNALDYVYEEWNMKPSAFVGYSGGPIAGTRAIEQLRLVTIELQMAPIQRAIMVGSVANAFNKEGEIIDESYAKKVANFFDQLVWWTRALKTARDKK